MSKQSSASASSSSHEELNGAKILTWARGLETFERLDFVYLLMHSLFPTELRYIHGIIDSLLKRDESLCSASVHQANDFARLSHFYESHDPHTVIAEDGLRRQFIVDLSALHPLNFYCADIFFNVLMRAELATWTFGKKSEKLLKEIILITTMLARHAAFRFDNRLYAWNISRSLRQKLCLIQEMPDPEVLQQTLLTDIPSVTESELVADEPVLSTSGVDRMLNGFADSLAPPPLSQLSQQPSAFPPLGAPARPALNCEGGRGKNNGDLRQLQNGPGRRKISTQRSIPGEFGRNVAAPSEAGSVVPLADWVDNNVLRRNCSAPQDSPGEPTGSAEGLPSALVIPTGKVKTLGTFPHVYSINIQNGPSALHLPPQPHPQLQIHQNNISNNILSCFVCGAHGHQGNVCPRKPPLDANQAVATDTPKMKWKFKELHPFVERKKESEKIRAKYPDRIPVIVEKAPGSNIQEIDKRKFLVPSDISIAQFMWIIRQRIQLPAEKAIFLFVGKVLPQSSANLSEIYEEHKDPDGFLYVCYSGENTFG